jgi:hypothetical protein
VLSITELKCRIKKICTHQAAIKENQGAVSESKRLIEKAPERGFGILFKQLLNCKA